MTHHVFRELVDVGVAVETGSRIKPRLPRDARFLVEGRLLGAGGKDRAGQQDEGDDGENDGAGTECGHDVLPD